MKDQVDGFSLDAQENNIRHYVETSGLDLTEIYVDAGISAKKGRQRKVRSALKEPGNFTWPVKLPAIFTKMKICARQMRKNASKILIPVPE